MPEEKRSLHRKLAQVMYEAERIPKNGTAPAAMGGFKFVQVGDAADTIRKALAEKNVSMIPSAVDIINETEHQTSNQKTMTTLTVRTTWTLTDGDTGESAVIQSLGSGADTGDKAAPKAQSNAMKYALLMGFLLSTGDDPEMTDTSDRQARLPRGGVPSGLEAPETAPARAPAAPAAPTGPEVEELLGVLTKEGNVKAGGGAGYKLEARQTPDGMALGFRLEVDGDRAIPQVLIEGQLAADVIDATAGKPESLAGKWAKVRGRLFNVSQQGRSSYYRLRVQSIETREWVLPLPEPHVDAPTAPLFTPQEERELDAALP